MLQVQPYKDNNNNNKKKKKKKKKKDTSPDVKGLTANSQTLDSRETYLEQQFSPRLCATNSKSAGSF